MEAGNVNLKKYSEGAQIIRENCQGQVGSAKTYTDYKSTMLNDINSDIQKAGAGINETTLKQIEAKKELTSVSAQLKDLDTVVRQQSDQAKPISDKIAAKTSQITKTKSIIADMESLLAQSPNDQVIKNQVKIRKEELALQEKDLAALNTELATMVESAKVAEFSKLNIRASELKLLVENAPKKIANFNNERAALEKDQSLFAEMTEKLDSQLPFQFGGVSEGVANPYKRLLERTIVKLGGVVPAPNVVAEGILLKPGLYKSLNTGFECLHRVTVNGTNGVKIEFPSPCSLKTCTFTFNGAKCTSTDCSKLEIDVLDPMS